MRRITLYTYYIEEERLSQTTDMILERDVIDIESQNERELVYAVTTNRGHSRRVSVASRSGEVYYNRDADCYRVWFDAPNRDKAIEAIGNYILDRIHPEIKHHESFIKHLQDEKLRAIKLLESIPKV